MVEIGRVRDAMSMCNKILPMVNNDEMNMIGNILLVTIERLKKEGRVELVEEEK